MHRASVSYVLNDYQVATKAVQGHLAGLLSLIWTICPLSNSKTCTALLNELSDCRTDALAVSCILSVNDTLSNHLDDSRSPRIFIVICVLREDGRGFRRCRICAWLNNHLCGIMFIIVTVCSWHIDGRIWSSKLILEQLPGYSFICGFAFTRFEYANSQSSATQITILSCYYYYSDYYSVLLTVPEDCVLYV